MDNILHLMPDMAEFSGGDFAHNPLEQDAGAAAHPRAAEALRVGYFFLTYQSNPLPTSQPSFSAATVLERNVQLATNTRPTSALDHARNPSCPQFSMALISERSRYEYFPCRARPNDPWLIRLSP